MACTAANSLQADPSGGRRRWVWVACGFVLVGLLAATLVVDQRPDEGAVGSALGVPVGPWLLMAAGAVCLLAAAVGPRGRLSGRALGFTILVAVAMRAPMWLSPIQPGADCHRYLWDGAMVANGVDPYRHAPHDIIAGRVDDPVVQQLARQGAATLEQINWQRLRTIYPPVAQGLFWAAHRIHPFSMTAWRIVLLAADVLAAVMVLKLLRSAGRPDVFALIYLWNPLLIWETYLGGHLDLAAAAVAMVGVWLLVHRRFTWAAAGFVVAAGIKLWPLLLLPFVLRPLWGRWRRLIFTAIIAAALTAAIGLLFATSLGPDSGLQSYSLTRFANPGAFGLLRGIGRWFPGDPDMVIRAVLAAVTVGASLALAWGAGVESRQLCSRMGIAAMLMLLLSPTLYPWYYVAAIPLAAISGSPAALVWTAGLPLCYWHVGEAREPMRWALTHLPVWCVLIGQGLWTIRARRRRVRTDGEDR